jgi:uncharacterized protein (TIGR03437 family)
MKFRPITLVALLVCLLFLGFSDTASAQPATITVTPSGVANPLNFNNVPAGATSPAQTVSVSTTVATSITIQVSATSPWISVTPFFANVGTGNPTLLSVRANTQGLQQGSYQGFFNVAQSGTVVATVYVNLTVSGASQLSADPTSLAFTANQGATSGSPSSSVVTISSSGPVLNYSVSASTTDNHNWLLLNTTSGTTSGAGITVSVNPSGLPVGNYNGSILVQSTTTGDSTTVAVTLTVTATAALTVTPANPPPFLYQIGGTLPAAQQLLVSATNASSSFSVSLNPPVAWLVLGATGGSASPGSPFPITLNVAPQGFPPGTYQTQVIVTPFGGAPLSPVTITFVVSNNPILKLQFNSLSFTAPFGGASPADQTVGVTTTSGNGNVGFSISTDQSWLSVTSSASTTPATLTVHVSPTNLQVGSYTGNITIRPNNGDNYSQVIVVTFTIGSQSLLVAGPPLLVFSYQINQPPPQLQIVQVQSTGQPVNFTVTSSTTNCGQGWIMTNAGSTTASSGSPANIAVSIVTQGMQPGVCSGTVNVNYNSGTAALAIQIPVMVYVSNNAELAISLPIGFGNYTVVQGGTLGATSISLNSSDNNITPLSFGAFATSQGGNWLTLGFNTLTTPATISVQFNPTGLAAGTYNGNVQITSPSISGPVNIPVVLTVTPNVNVTATPPPPGPIVFTQAQGATPPASQTITLSSSGPGAAPNFVASVTQITGGNWLQVSPGSGTASGAITLTVLQNNLPVNTYNAQVTISLQGASTSSLVYNVTLNVTQQQTVTVTPNGALNFAFQIGSTTPASQKITVTSTGGSVNLQIGTTTITGGKWLKADVTSGRTPLDINVSVDPTGLIAGIYNGSITISAQGVLSNPIVINVSLTITAAPAPSILTITSNATNQAGPVAPGEIITIKGTSMGPTSPANGVLFRLNAVGAVDPILAGVRVLFNGTPGTPIFVSATQINVTVPYEVASFATANVIVEFNGIQSTAVQVRVTDVVLGLYTLNSTGSGQAAAVNGNLTYNGPPSTTTIPAPQGGIVTLYATGGGQSVPASVTGGVTGFGTLYRIPNNNNFTATVGGVPANIDFIGEAPGLVTGVIQINLHLGTGASGNALPVDIKYNGISILAGPSGAVTVAVQ